MQITPAMSPRDILAGVDGLAFDHLGAGIRFRQETRTKMRNASNEVVAETTVEIDGASDLVNRRLRLDVTVDVGGSSSRVAAILDFAAERSYLRMALDEETRRLLDADDEREDYWQQRPLDADISRQDIDRLRDPTAIVSALDLGVLDEPGVQALRPADEVRDGIPCAVVDLDIPDYATFIRHVRSSTLRGQVNSPVQLAAAESLPAGLRLRTWYALASGVTVAAVTRSVDPAERGVVLEADATWADQESWVRLYNLGVAVSVKVPEADELLPELQLLDGFVDGITATSAEVRLGVRAGGLETLMSAYGSPSELAALSALPPGTAARLLASGRERHDERGARVDFAIREVVGLDGTPYLLRPPGWVEIAFVEADGREGCDRFELLDAGDWDRLSVLAAGQTVRGRVRDGILGRRHLDCVTLPDGSSFPEPTERRGEAVSVTIKRLTLAPPEPVIDPAARLARSIAEAEAEEGLVDPEGGWAPGERTAEVVVTSVELNRSWEIAFVAPGGHRFTQPATDRELRVAGLAVGTPVALDRMWWPGGKVELRRVLRDGLVVLGA